MKKKIEKYKIRRMKRILSRLDAEDDEEGKWITTENNHKVHLNEEGDPDKGNPNVIDKMMTESDKKQVIGSVKSRMMEELSNKWPSSLKLGDICGEFPIGTVLSWDGYVYQKIEDGRWAGTGADKKIRESSFVGGVLSIPGSKDNFKASYSDEKIDLSGYKSSEEGKKKTEPPKENKSVEKEPELAKSTGSLKLRHPNEAFASDRKNAAVWDKNGGSEFDEIMRGITSKIWTTKGINQDALWRYTTDKDYGYGDMNYQLRNGAMDWWTDYDKNMVQGNVDSLTKAIDMSEAPKDMWLQRGCSAKSLCKLFGVPENEWSGFESKDSEEILKAISSYVDYGQDKAFLSCGSGKGKGTNAPVILNIYCPKGTKMLYAEPFSKWGNGGGKSWDGKTGQTEFSAEDETILQRGTMIVPKKVSKKDGRIYVDVDVIGQEY